MRFTILILSFIVAHVAQAQVAVFVRPSFQGRPILAEVPADNAIGSQYKSLRANVACQMAGFAQAVKSSVSLVVKPNTELFAPESIIVGRDLFASEYPMLLGEHSLFMESQTPQFILQKKVEECSVASTCRGAPAQELFMGMHDIRSPFVQACFNWPRHSKNYYVFTQLICATNDGSSEEGHAGAVVTRFHERTGGKFRLDAQPYNEDIITLQPAQCENPLAQGSIDTPKPGQCDYDMSRRDWGSPPSAFQENLEMYMTLSGRFKRYDPTTPQCTLDLIKKYQGQFVKPEYHLTIDRYYIPFCVDNISAITQTNNSDSSTCSFSVQGHDFMGQASNVTVTLGRDSAESADLCQAQINCWQATQVSCSHVNFCPAPGISNDSAYRYQNGH